MPGIPLATGKQQDCLLYLVTIATGLECEAIMVALCWAEARPVAWTDRPRVAARAGPCFGGFVLSDHCTRGFSLLEKALLWNTDLLRTWCSFECRWMTLLAGASRARGKC